MTTNENDVLWPSDESLQSYLFRILKLYGFSDYSTILVPKSGWGINPSIPLEAKHLLTDANKSHLLKLFEESIHIPKNESDFVFLFDYIDLFNRTFFPQNRRRSAGKGMNIHFCPSCMEEQLYKYGYSYFKSCWNNQLYCIKHSKSLLSLKPSSMSSMIKNVDKVLKCEVDNNFTFISKSTQSSSHVLAKRSVKFSPCAKNQLRIWVLQSSKYYLEGFTETIDYGLLNGKERKAFNSVKYKKEVRLYWEDIYQQLTELSHKELIEFIQENMTFDFVKYQKNGIFSGPKAILKDKTRNCNKCMLVSNGEYSACPKKNLIYSTSISSSNSFFDHIYTNLCESMYLELEADIEKHQNDIGVRKGETRVKKEIETSRQYRKLGGKDKYMKYLQDTMKSVKIITNK